MNPILASFIGSLLRYALMLLVPYFVKHGIFTESVAEGYVEAAVAGLLALGWSWWKIHGNRVKLLTALSLPQGSTENDVKAAVASGAAPSVLTPPDTAPAAKPATP
jgi:hypothetical protein